jgi:hypothetical protein
MIKALTIGVGTAVCACCLFATPSPTVAQAAIKRLYKMHPYQQQVFSSARPGDLVVCRSGAAVVRLRVPTRHVGVFKQLTVSPDHRLALSLSHRPHGGAFAFCRWR